MSNPYSNNDSFNPRNNSAENPGNGKESAPYGHDTSGNPGYAGAAYPDNNSLFGPDVDAIQVIADSFRYFGRNWAQWLFGPLIQIVGIFIIFYLVTGILAFGGTSIDSMVYDGSGAGNALTGGIIAILFIVVIAVFVLVMWAKSTWFRAANKQIETGSLQFADFLSLENAGGLIAAYVLSNLIIALGFVLLIIPGLVALFFFWWMPAVKAVRPELSIGECFGASIKVAQQNVGVTILVGVLLLVLNAVLSFTVVGLIIYPALQTFVAVIFVRRTLGMRS